ncbi:HD-GYP domain-containing protein [Paludibacterium purpuratum]|uniref:Putative nucleotidyltransferase with HDIG domain n=1 Tax=Paludibacterium purpuratum TaxID=1144873 RepID=A0A4R7B5S3_9NEIS|nr:HD-GYP domain-containing protein [Paludibacterium purpuratum]TDR79968.1 putative nucleotidyltransferase with HDIG domain [Paludibacterium purpuratum]
MIKKIPVERLRPGMFLHNLNSGWMSHPFLRNRFLVTEESMVEKIIGAGIHELYIDTSRGLDDADAPTEAEVNQQLMEEMQAAVSSEAPYRCTTVAEELPNARRLRARATRIIRSVMQDAKMGKAINLEEVNQLVGEIIESILRNDSALMLLLRVRAQNDYTLVHSVAVSAMMVTFCYALNCDRATLHQAGVGGLLHDIGKVRVPVEILNKPGRYTEYEYDVMKRHPKHGLEILQMLEGIPHEALDVALNHHERLDGSGYPHGQGRETISRMARMAAIADVYDAITSDRCYHTAMPPTAALKKMWEWSRHHFDPDLMRAFMTAIGIYPVGTLVKLESGRIAVVVEPHEHEVLKPKVRAFFSTHSNLHIPTQLIDLSRPFGAGGGDRIVGYEDPRKWNLDPTRYLSDAP